MRGLREAQAAIGAVTAEGRGAGGMIRVAADGRGRLTGVDLDPRVMRLPAGALATEALKAIQDAQEAAGRQAQEIAERAREHAEAFPEPLDEEFVRRRVEQVAREIE
ncbi:hypothetical protein Sme01_26080 [Sphaerisporangium melleum]|uniref:YbaB/EbfC family nucleoid-associated protein n=2 Tax=Sphaerisporangium melleum TaxID=321316 RepID=A0A917QQV0_9ACTN|nr:hypothetical protein GCM10007964_03860 [Sphaerisporangium melleum]GII70132.1 hypothetical protein Sme01_26080 [Sphaerisporangium melleum]